eukprot:CAMPEP_0206230128 /NCGR_PEP_ID=MMETSP0047_2-20121206/10076_1 /ASSEMBLY_ACC=CAM_ASM_000192 /TAXON_ID=195065 /ORGANISM="Chroomonas mesostigmatica_cf, Strain CCMP1168" /LENGTH=41 /DNA_ID= /DNA_START= /DNA_END= /DNA_ORIENTATION=
MTSWKETLRSGYGSSAKVRVMLGSVTKVRDIPMLGPMLGDG